MAVIYEGFFLNCNITGALEKDVKYKHMTTEFRPKESHEDLYGEFVVLHASKYSIDIYNEGYYIDRIVTNNDELKKIFNEVSIPHVTLSTSVDGKPVDTAKLDFDKGIPIDIYLPAKYGCFTGIEYIMKNKEEK